jgi:hypothetical protein
MSNGARRFVLPTLALSIATENPTEGSTPVTLKRGQEELTYYRTPVRSVSGKRIDGGPEWSFGRYSRFPIVRCGDGSPWAEAAVYLIDTAEIKTEPNMLTLGNLADDLASYRTFIEAEEVDWLTFGPRKFTRPTYRFSAHLKTELRTGRVSAGVAKRRMSTVVRFYNWLIKNQFIAPSHPPWVEQGVALVFRDDKGFEQIKPVVTTDVSIKVPQAIDPWDDRIDDGGKLRPLLVAEQRAMLEALAELGNTEIMLMHHLALMTGAREQTVLTLRKRHFAKPPSAYPGNEVRITCGPGTGIDTKKNKKGILHVPKYLYEKLHIYALSARAVKRRARHPMGDVDTQYLFLTQHGKPFYESIEDRHALRVRGERVKGTKQGQSLRGFITKRVLPTARKILRRDDFKYRFHDLRASFGMNYVDFCAERDRDGRDRELVLKHLAKLMWHTNVATTLRYLDYRRNLHMIEAAEKGWSEYLVNLIVRKEAEVD